MGKGNGTCNAWQGKRLAFCGDPERPRYGHWMVNAEGCECSQAGGTAEPHAVQLPLIGGGLEEPPAEAETT